MSQYKSYKLVEAYVLFVIVALCMLGHNYRAVDQSAVQPEVYAVDGYTGAASYERLAHNHGSRQSRVTHD